MSLPTSLIIVQPLATAVMLIALYFLLALLVAALSRHLARVVTWVTYLAPQHQRPTAERRQTLQGLVASGIKFAAFVVALVATLALFIQSDTLIWMIGLFSAAFGLGARAFVNDLLAGGGFIFRNTFAIGEKIEMVVGMDRIQGVIERVNVLDTLVRAQTGELFTVPNGEIRVIRNFSRAAFSSVKLAFMVSCGDLARTVSLLEALGQEAVTLLPDLMEPWQVLAAAETLGRKTPLTVIAKATFAHAATVKLEIAQLLQARLHAAGIELTE